MSKYEWLLFLHVTGAFIFFAGMVMALVLSVAALTRERPSEVVLFMRLTRVAVAAFGVSLVLILVFGLWLVDAAQQGYGYGDGWVVAALILFILSNVLGALGGRRAEPTRELAEELAAGGDQPSAELRQRLRDPVVMVFDYGAAVLGLVVLVLMIWKPGAG